METKRESDRDLAFHFVSDLALKLNAGKLELPSCPDIVLHVRRVLDDPNTSAEKIARVVSTEPVLAARLMKIANSALLGAGGQQVADLSQAILRLGYNMVRNSAMAVATEQLLSAKGVIRLQPHLKQLWRHSVRVAAIAYIVARKLVQSNPDEAMLAGLLHDIGKLYILTEAEHHPELFVDDNALEMLMQQWHTGIGKAILDSWELPEAIGIAADEHETLERDHPGIPDLADIVLVANLYAHLDERSERFTDVDWELVPAVGRLKLDPQASANLLEESSREIDSLAAALAS